MQDSPDQKPIDPKLVELLDKLSPAEIEMLTNESKDKDFIEEIKYTLRMVPKLK